MVYDYNTVMAYDVRERLGYPWDRLAEQKKCAAVLIAAGRPVREVAVQLGLVQKTIKNWLTEDEFINEIRQLRERSAILNPGNQLNMIAGTVLAMDKEINRRIDSQEFKDIKLKDLLRIRNQELNMIIKIQNGRVSNNNDGGSGRGGVVQIVEDYKKLPVAEQQKIEDHQKDILDLEDAEIGEKVYPDDGDKINE